MQKEDVIALSHIFTSIKEAVSRLEDAQKAKNVEAIMISKREIMKLQSEVKKLL